MKKLSLVLAVMLLASAVWSLAAGAAEYTLGVGDVPVSYTHLDVYKRQGGKRCGKPVF